MNKFYLIVIIFIGLFSCNNSKIKTENIKVDSLSKEKKSTNTSTLKSIAIQAQDAIWKYYNEADVRKYLKSDYIQHNPEVATGIEPIIEILPLLQKEKASCFSKRILQDGNFIIFHNIYDNLQHFGSKQIIAFDIWRMEDGKVAEHWDCTQPFTQEQKNKSGRTPIDGETEIKDLDKTTSNKKLVEDFYHKVFVEGKKEEAENYISKDTYIQHSIGGTDGFDNFYKFLNFYITEDYKPAKIHRVFGEGNFVLLQVESIENNIPYASYDLFRVENNKIVEHWDILQKIPEEMAHSNGMF